HDIGPIILGAGKMGNVPPQKDVNAVLAGHLFQDHRISFWDITSPSAMIARIATSVFEIGARAQWLFAVTSTFIDAIHGIFL
ncbi:hypothetical protein, partial [Rhizobium sp. Root483D2]|uniref:hypothetical protein n=1 Tax=Rhizobium sp. Root483D2 TaxID=1736545 RepID=UPI00138F0079